MDSILDSVKSYCGLLPDDTAFDSDILMAINAIMVVLNQLGVGPENPLVVEDSSQEWTDLLGENPIGGVREYVNMRVRMLFDPPSNTYVMQALKDQIDQFEWRIIAEVDKVDYAAREVEDA